MKKILVIDDEPEFTVLLQRAMPEFTVRVVADPKVALTTARRFKPDVFILDLVMPGIDGPIWRLRYGVIQNSNKHPSFFCQHSFIVEMRQTSLSC